MVHGSGFRASGFGFRFQGVGPPVSGFGISNSGFGASDFRILGFGVRIWDRWGRAEHAEKVGKPG